MATRLRESGYWSWEVYGTWKTAWNAYLETLPPSKPFATPVMKALGRGGRTYTQLVLEALDANRITSVDASRYLDLKFQHFDNLREGLMGGAQNTVAFE
jgi:hypoxanthine phosphoribosyltransferase